MVPVRKISQIWLLVIFALVYNKAVPHHHHSREICLPAEHCNEEGPGQHEHGSNEQKDHPDPHDHGTCHLESMYLIVKNSNHENKKRIVTENTVLDIQVCFSSEGDRRGFSRNSGSVIILQGSADNPIQDLTRAMRAPPV